MSSPEAPSKLEIEVAPAATAEDDRVVGEITDLINRVYATAEAELWVDDLHALVYAHRLIAPVGGSA
jgi:hypothetical protein